jgi:UDP-glucose 4-epimerase
MRILVVGGGSNPGRCFRRRLNKEDWVDVVVLARAPIETYGLERLIVVTDYFSLDPVVFDSVDVVVNFAGIVRGSRQELYAVNAEGAACLGTLAKRSGVRHFVQISSLSVYGGAETIESTTPEEPVSDYGRSKRAGDAALASLAESNFAVTMLRCPAFYGAGIDGKLRLLAKVMRRLGWFPVPPVLNERSVLHLDNLAEALLAVVRDRRCGIQFAADPECFTLALLAKAGSAHASRPIKLVTLPRAVFLLLRLAAKNLYGSVYGRGVISAPLVPIRAPSLSDTLMDLY